MYAIKPKTNFSRFNDFGEDVEQLEEVLIEAEASKIEMRERKLNEHTFGRVDVLDERDKILYNTLRGYLVSKGIGVSEGPGFFNASSSLSGMTSINARSGMAIFLDDMPLLDTGILYQYSLLNLF